MEPLGGCRPYVWPEIQRQSPRGFAVLGKDKNALTKCYILRSRQKTARAIASKGSAVLDAADYQGQPVYRSTDLLRVIYA